jgi:uncharacterized membrane protein YqaE (UPF0057 family)
MRYLLAFVFPPLAILLCGRPFLAIVSIPLLGCYFPAAIVALLVVSEHKAKTRQKQFLNELRAIHTEPSGETRRHPHVDQGFHLPAPPPEKKRPAKPAPVEAPTPEEPAEPRVPLGERLKALGESAKLAYNALPEWGQPVIWGLAAATPFSAAIVFWQLAR